jgi:cyclopropane fatty-acyl-phospholipid synthase-like methyltransferase
MELTDNHKNIVEYYKDTENAYKDSWDLHNSLAIHYGYWDEEVSSFPQSLLRMNEVMMEAAAIKQSDNVLDAGCGVGGSSIFLASTIGCNVTGITLSERQVEQATANAKQKGAMKLVDFKVMDYCATDFPEASFDVVWGCESICYADDKEKFLKEAYRLLKPGGRLVVADGFVTRSEYNERPVIRKWLDGWQVKSLESRKRFENLLGLTGFIDVQYRNISKNVAHSSRRLLKYYFLAKLFLWWKALTFSNRSTKMQRKNIIACWHQYWGLKMKFWQYGLFVSQKS